MGGGDLNLKKSWHPQTLRNIERVWKAEQKFEAEQKKIEQLRKELQEERAREELRQYAEDQGVIKKKSERLDWMYAGPASHVNHEEYLLGRPVDKALEILNGDISHETEEREKPGAIFNKSGCNAAVDLANKIREDPLFAIRKREEESRKELLNNPIRLKQLQQMLKAKLGKKDKKKSKKDKKHKKSENENKVDEKKKIKSENLHKSEQNHHYKNKQREKMKIANDSHISFKSVRKLKHNSSSSEEEGSRRTKPEGYGLIIKNGYKHISSKPSVKLGRYSRSSSRSPSRKENSKYSKVQRNDEDNSRSHSRSPVQKLTSKYESKSHHSQIHIRSSRDNEQYRSYSSHSMNQSHSESNKRKYEVDSQERYSKKKRDPQEMEKLRKEMMENAKWRDEQLTQKVKQYREDAAAEEEYLKNRKAKAEFIIPMLSKAAETDTVENRIKRNIYNVQRTKLQKDSFLKR